MKGVILGIQPDCLLIDLTHGVESFSTLDGARELETIAWLPIGIHVCVVDFGVGTGRRALLLETGRGDHIIGPDNGVLIPAALRLGGITKCWSIENPRYMVLPVSDTLHGRDVFAPCAAWLSKGAPPEDFGPQLDPVSLVPQPFTEAVFDSEHGARCQIIHINKFGTLTLSLRDTELERVGLAPGSSVGVELNGAPRVRLPLVKTFGDLPLGQELVLIDAYGRVAIGVNQASAADRFGARLADSVRLTVGEG